MRTTVRRSWPLAVASILFTLSPAAPAAASPALELAALPILVGHRGLHDPGVAEDGAIGGTWRITGSRLGADDRLTLDLQIMSGLVSSALDPGPAVLVGRVSLFGDAGGDIGAGGAVPHASLSLVPACTDQTGCRHEGSITLPTDRLARIARSQNVRSWSFAGVSLALVRTFDQGAIVQVEPFQSTGHVGTQGTVGAPDHLAGTMLAADPVAAADLQAPPRSGRLFRRIERLRAEAQAATVSPSPIPTTSPRPSAAPGPVAPPANALDWSAPMAEPDPGVRTIAVIDGGLVAVGQGTNGLTSRASAWWSADGTDWARTLSDGRKGGYTTIDVLADTGHGLVAIGQDGVMRCGGGGEGDGGRCRHIPVAIWRSEDGRSWDRVDPGTAFDHASVLRLAAGPLGVMAIGADRSGRAMTWRSTDGTAWTAARLDEGDFDRARLMDVAATADGWVLVGSTGAKDVPAGGVMTPNGSAGAAWTSADGVTWQPARVSGTGEQVELRDVLVGRGGMAATGTLTGGKQGAAWTSADGSTWDLVAPGPTGLADPWPAAADGTTIMGWTYPGDESTPLAWSASTDGVNWTPLSATGAADTRPAWSGDRTYEDALLTGGELIARGYGRQNRPTLWRANASNGPTSQPSPS